MKIAIVTEVSTSHVNGVSRTISKLLDHIIETNNEAIVIGPESGTYRNKVPLIGTVGVPLFFYPELRLNFLNPSMLFEMVKFNPDVIHFVDPNLLGPQVLLFCKIFLPNTPIVSSYHTNIAFYAKLFGFSMLHNPIWATHRLYHSPSKYILCPSHSTKSALGENGFELNKIIVWSRGVDRSLFTPSRRNELLRKSWINSTTTCINMPKFLSMSNLSSNSGRRKSYGILNNTPFINKDEGVAFGLSIPENKRILLYVGRISWEKNLRVLVEAFKRMNHEEYHLVVIGDGPAKVSLEAGLKHTGSVTFTGYLKGEQLAEAYASSDIFTFPSVSETFGQVVLEAQASGLPVVAMRSEGVKEIVSDGVSGILVDPTQDEERVIEEYQKAIIDISNDYKKYNSMSKHAVSISKQFTWEKAMGKCMDAYKAACHETQLS